MPVQTLEALRYRFLQPLGQTVQQLVDGRFKSTAPLDRPLKWFGAVLPEEIEIIMTIRPGFVASVVFRSDRTAILDHSGFRFHSSWSVIARQIATLIDQNGLCRNPHYGLGEIFRLKDAAAKL